MKSMVLAVALLSLSPSMAFAGHGKAGLWTISTTMDMGVKMPSAQTFSTQMCMTQAEVDADKPPPMGRNDTGCTSHIVSQTGTAMTSEMVCNGEMKGTGRVQVSYSGPEHYSGSYSFKGLVHGQPMNTTSSFKGDWVKADCGVVKPYIAK